MRIHRVRLRNFRGVTDSEVEFSTTGVTVIEGPNEIGKTSLHEAIRLAVDLPDSSRSAAVKSAQPVDRDEAPEVEFALSTGAYELTLHKRWMRRPATTLRVTAPRGESLTGREAHDRFRAILEETLDSLLWEALRIEQGTQLKSPSFDMPSLRAALDLAVGDHAASDHDDALWERVCAEHDKYWTARGKPRGEHEKSAEHLRQAEDHREELKGRLDAIEGDAEEMSRLENEAGELRRTGRESSEEANRLDEQWQEIERLQAKVQGLEAERSGAESHLEVADSAVARRREQVKSFEDHRQELSKLREEAKRATPALEAAKSRHAEAKEALATARKAAAEADETRRLADQDLQHMQRVQELANLSERQERHASASRDHREARKTLEAAKVDDDLLESIQEAHETLVRAQAEADLAAASVETTALADLTVTFGAERAELAQGETRKDSVVDELVIELADTARLRVRAALASQGRLERRADAESNLRRVCEEGAVADASEARRSRDLRRDAQRDAEVALKAIQRELGELTEDQLQEQIGGLSDQIAEYRQQRGGDGCLPEDHETAGRAAADAAKEHSTRRSKVESCQEAETQAFEAFNKVKVDSEVLAARIRDMEAQQREACERLTQARDDRSDEQLEARASAARQQLEAALRRLEQAKGALSDADPESQKACRDNARAVAERCARNLRSNEDRRNELRGRLDSQGEMGLHTLHEQAVADLHRSQLHHEREKARACAAGLLKQVFESRRNEARERYVGPFKDQVERLGRIVFGSSFKVELDEEMRVSHRTLDGTTLEVAQLSTGAREQLGMLCRLACAALVSPDDKGAPVMIDDALGWSDPERLQRMGAALAEAGKHCQVIVLTCTPQRYSHVGNAKTVRLDPQP